MQDLTKYLDQFLAKYSGTLADISTLTRRNHQHPFPPDDGFLTCVTARAHFDNVGIFGSSGPFLTSVFPRYRALLARLTEFLAEQGITANTRDSTLNVSIVPSPGKKTYVGEPLPKVERESRGALILRVSELAGRSEYYRKLARSYPVQHGVLTNNGTVVGPDWGIISSAATVAKSFDRPVRLIELGTGAGTTVEVLFALGKLKSYRGNDFSPEMIDFFSITIRPRLVAAGISCELTAGSCYEFEPGASADLLIVGVYYEAQPDLCKLRGNALAASLDPSGIIAIQSGKPENQFITELMHGDSTQHTLWPWYEKGFRVSNHFRHVVKVDVHDETMLIGGHDSARVDQVATLLCQEAGQLGIDQFA